MYTIYKRTTPDGRVYIGCTKRSLEARAGVQGVHYKQDVLFWKAIQRFGWESVQTVILHTTESCEEACALELACIKEYDALNPDVGLNSRLQSYVRDSESWSKLLSAKATAAWKRGDTWQRHALSQQARFKDPQERLKISESVKRILSNPDIRAKISEAGVRRYQDLNQRLKTSVISRQVWSDPERVSRQKLLLKHIMADPEIRRKISENTRQGLASSETRQRMSEAAKTKWADPEYRARTQASMQAACSTPEHRARASEVGKEVQNRPEVKAKISAAFSGLIFVNDGTRCKRVHEAEAVTLVQSGSWVRGRLPKTK